MRNASLEIKTSDNFLIRDFMEWMMDIDGNVHQLNAFEN